MSFDVMPIGWLPTQEAVKNYCEQRGLLEIKVPSNHLGTNESLKLAEIYVNGVVNNTINEDVADSSTPLYLLTKFYTGKAQYAIPVNISKYFLDRGVLGDEELLTYLYIYSWNTQRATITISTIRNLVTSKSDLTSITHTDLNNFVDVTNWLNNEGITVPSKLAWALKDSPEDRRIKLFTKTNGETAEMLRVLDLGGDWFVLENHFLGEGELPLEFLENIFGEKLY